MLFLVLYSLESNVAKAVRLNCTAQCSFQMSFDDQFQRPSDCSQRIISDRCVARVTILYNTRQIFFYFRTFGLESNGNGFTLYAVQQVSHIFKSNYSSYIIIFACFFADDCDWIYIQDIINRFTKIDYALVFNELKSSLYDHSNVPVAECYSQNKIINCNNGLCSSIVFEDNLLINRSCVYRSDFSGGIDIRRYRVFSELSEDNQNYISYQCNQNLCNDPTTEKSVESIIRSYTSILDILQPSKAVAVSKNAANYLIVIVILLQFL